MTDAPMSRADRRRARRIRRFDNPWLNPKLFWGVGLLLGIIVLGILGRVFWDPERMISPLSLFLRSA